MVPSHLWPPDINLAARKSLAPTHRQIGCECCCAQHAQCRHERRRACSRDAALYARLAEWHRRIGRRSRRAGCCHRPWQSQSSLSCLQGSADRYFFTALDELCPRADKAGTELWVENMPFAFLPKIGELMDVLDRYGNPRIGIVWDAANSHFAHEDLGQSLRRCRDRLKLVHLSDTNRWQYRHDAVGLGTVPFAEIPPILAEIGYDRRAILEVISHDADRDILASAQRLTEKGFAAPAGTSKRVRSRKAKAADK